MLLAREGTVSMQGGTNINFFLQDGYINMVKGDSTTELFLKNIIWY